MKNKKIIVGSAALVAVITSMGLTGISLAYHGDPNLKGPNYTPERHEVMLNAIENLDYKKWKELHEETGRGRRITTHINEENFAKFKEMHNLRLSGDIEGADKIRNELGLGQGKRWRNNGNGQGRHQGKNQGGQFIDNDKDGICDNLK